MISAYCKKLKYNRKIVLITNGTGLMNSEGIDEIQKKLKEDNIQITVM
jgi:ATP-dependent DNA helicase 2 subunit 2